MIGRAVWLVQSELRSMLLLATGHSSDWGQMEMEEGENPSSAKPEPGLLRFLSFPLRYLSAFLAFLYSLDMPQYVPSSTLDTVQKQLKWTRIWGSQSCTTRQSLVQTI